MLETVKKALRVSSTAFDTEITQIINAALKDLIIAGVSSTVAVYTSTDALIIQAVITYAKAHFGDRADAEKMMAAYNEQKGQLRTATGYTTWTT